MVVLVIALLIIGVILPKIIKEKQFEKLESEVLKKIGFSKWNIMPEVDEYVHVNSRQTVEKYDEIKYFKEHKDKLEIVKRIIKDQIEIVDRLKAFLADNEYKTHPQYRRIVARINITIKNIDGYKVRVKYTSPAGRINVYRVITITENVIKKCEDNPMLLMGKTEYNKYLKEQQHEALAKKQHEYYELVNQVVDFANDNKETLFIKGGLEKMDNLVSKLFDRTVKSIIKNKTIDSEEWQIVWKLINSIKSDIHKIVTENQRILEYYKSPDFLKIKETCETLMSTQREFNEYISEKVETISLLFGRRVVRNETVIDDEYQYIRPYKKIITPFTAEVSATVFSSAENNPLEYVVKFFYPNKKDYKNQIQKLHLLIEELGTLKEAKRIIENYKKEYKQYLGSVPSYVMDNDEAGFYSRLGFANIDESVLSVEYKFSYTSGGGMAKRTFDIPMTEETIVELIRALEVKLSDSAFTKEQRALMTSKLREFIKKRDDFTCCNCRNSTHIEPNLLLEIDHIIPVSKGGCTIEENLQTLCWKCNRAKSNKIASCEIG